MFDFGVNCPFKTPFRFLKEKMEASIKQGALKEIIQLCLWKEPGVHWRRGVSFESDEEFRSDLQLRFG